jgi:hypothetical protein
MRGQQKTGRPAKPRSLVAGERLLQALRLLGKTWRKNTQDSNHVLKWDRWAIVGLPRSPTTIDTDMRLGVPEERLSAYAECLGLSPKQLLSPDEDLSIALGTIRPTKTPLPPLNLGFGDAFQNAYLAYNSRAAVKELFELMGGVFRLYYALPISEAVHRCSLWFYAAEEHIILAHGLFVRFGLDNFFEANLFRWHNNLHGRYLCDNHKELGTLLLVDPLRHNLVMRRKPFWLKGQGVTDSGLADNAPIYYTLRMEKVPTPFGLTPGELWDLECEELRRRPHILPGDPDYASLLDEVLTPDVLA